jgi:hypothetical protein
MHDSGRAVKDTAAKRVGSTHLGVATERKRCRVRRNEELTGMKVFPHVQVWDKLKKVTR